MQLPGQSGLQSCCVKSACGFDTKIEVSCAG